MVRELKKGEQAMPLAITLYMLVCAGLLIQICLTLLLTSLLPGLTDSFAGTLYWFTLPHLILLPVTLVAAVIQAKHRTIGAVIFSEICLGCSLLTSLYPVGVWSGVGDGWGMAWFFFLGGASLLNVVIGIPMIYIAHRIYPSNK